MAEDKDPPVEADDGGDDEDEQEYGEFPESPQLADHSAETIDMSSGVTYERGPNGKLTPA